ncbi:hypothetical protein JL722_2040 [Aureococcus anophagefferens]|nr:hypothetical protein JL722_2040 [Aureococcus anophagefferens]
MAAFVPYLGDIQLCGTNAPAPDGGAPAYAPAPDGGAPASPSLRSARYAAGAAAAGVLLETPGPDGRARPKATPRKSIAFLKRTMSRLRRSVKELPDNTAVALGIKRDRVRDLVQEAMLRSTNGKCSWAFGIWSRAYLRERYEERRAEKGWVAIALEGGGLPWSQVDPDAAPSKDARRLHDLVELGLLHRLDAAQRRVPALHPADDPLEASFLPRQTRGSALWGIDRFLDAAFIYDITVNFRTGYYESMTDDAPEVLDLRKCANRYLKSWFLLDFVSSMPPVIEAIMSVATKGSSNSVNALRALKVLKIGRVFRVFKVVRVSSVLQGDSAAAEAVENFFISSASQFVGNAFSILVTAVLIAHLLACGMGLSGDGWFKTYECADDDGAAGDDCFMEKSWKKRYLMAFYWSITTMSSVGYGDVTPASDGERAYNVLAMVFGVAFYSYIIGVISSLVLQKDAKNAKYFEKMESVSNWITHHNLDIKMRRRIRTALRTYYESKSAIDEREILANLSPGLQQELSSTLLSGAVYSHPLFAKLPQGAVWKIVIILQRDATRAGASVIASGMPTSSLYFLNDGYCDLECWEISGATGTPEKKRFIINEGSSFGERRPRPLPDDALFDTFAGLPEAIASMKARIRHVATNGCRIMYH